MLFGELDTHTNRLRCASVVASAGVPAPQFEGLTQKLTFQRGVGLPGRVWAHGQPAWIPEIGLDDNSPRRAAAQEDGLRSAFAVPIVLRGECLGVLEFFSHEPRPPDLAMLEMMNSLGTQIGQLIERHQMRARVMQSEKLASLGMLSAGVAHEINNPLAYVSNNLAVLERDVRFLLMLLSIYDKADASLAATEPELVRQATRLASEFDLRYVKDNMGKILRSTRQGVKRVADIVQNLRGFARLDQAAVDQADIHEALRTAVEMLRGRLDRRHIAVEEHFGELPLVAGSPAQLNQVFLNLLVNAMHAIESTHRQDGRIAITTAAMQRRNRRRGRRQRLRNRGRRSCRRSSTRSSRPRMSVTAPDWVSRSPTASFRTTAAGSKSRATRASALASAFSCRWSGTGPRINSVGTSSPSRIW